MDGSVSITIGALLGFAGFLVQGALTLGAIIYSHGALNQRVRTLEEKVKDSANLATSVTRLETEMESVGREIKGLREDLKLLRFRPVGHARSPSRSPYATDMSDWVTEDER